MIRSHRLAVLTTIISIASGFASLSARAATATVRTSSMNEDIAMSQSLYKALKASSGKVPQIQASSAGSFDLVVNQDKLSCSTSGCELDWDTTSETYPQDAGAFNAALYTVLNAWATSADGANDASTHRVVYPRTGSVVITLHERFGLDDEIECSSITGYTDCSLVVSDIRDGAGATLQSLFSTLLAAPSLISDQTKALLTTVSTPQYSTPGKPGSIEAVHTLYTGLLEDAYVVTGYYAFVTPITNAAGQIIADGVSLTLTGSANGASWEVQIAQAQAYALVRPVPPRAGSPALGAQAARARAAGLR